MTLNEFADMINVLIREGHGQKTIVFSKDDEGNEFNKVTNMPTVGVFDSDNQDYLDEDAIEDWYGNESTDVELNAICIN